MNIQTLILINANKKNQLSIKLIEASASQRGVEVKVVEPNSYNHLQNKGSLKNCGIYRISTDPHAIYLEKTVISQVGTSFYSNIDRCISEYENVFEATLIHERNKLPVIPTIYHLTNDNLLLRKYYERLGGPPIIIKIVGGSHGVGVIKVDSFSSLLSVADYLLQNNQQAILRKFIKHEEHARLIVLGDTVISSIAYKKAANDFRTNVGEKLNVISKQYNNHVQKIAVRATKTLGFEFAGVDIITDKNGTPYLAEVNFPCYFPRAQEATGDDISGMMIDHLMEKAKKDSQNPLIIS